MSGWDGLVPSNFPGPFSGIVKGWKTVMKLQLEWVFIEDVRFGDKTSVSKRTLTINRQELVDLLTDDENFESVNIVLAKPGDDARIVNVVDVVEPRCKVSGGVDFPGFMGAVRSAGRGVTRALKGAAVVFCDRHPHWLHSKSIIDMSGPGAGLGRYANTLNIAVDPTPNGDVASRDYARSVKLAGLKAAVYLAKAAASEDVEKIDTFDLGRGNNVNQGLPRIGYYYQIYSPQHDSRGIPDPIFYGHPIATTFPLVVHPNEIIDGGVMSGTTIRMMESYSIQNHPVIFELHRRHGKDLDFAGVVIGVASMESARRPLSAMMVGNLMKDTLAADGVLLTKPLGGAPTIDLGEAALECENLGIKTCLLIQVLNTESFLESEVMFNSPSLNAIVNTGIIFERVMLPALGTIIGGTADTPVFNDSRKQSAGQ